MEVQGKDHGFLTTCDLNVPYFFPFTPNNFVMSWNQAFAPTFEGGPKGREAEDKFVLMTYAQKI